MKPNRIAVLGNFMGDEGKGHIVHALAPDYDWVVRYAGGSNAGHTIYRDGKKYVHNLMPSVDWRNPRTKAFLGPGMVIDLEQLCKEVAEVKANFPGAEKRIYIDPDAFVVTPKHKEQDREKNGNIGTTNRGIGPAYTDKIARTGYRMKMLWNTASDPYYADPYYADFIYHLHELGTNFKHVLELRSNFESSSILYEGAQGVLLDLNHGAYPYVSCGDCTVAGVYANGFSFAAPTEVLGVAKVYSTKVGEGPFPTEYHGEEAETLRKMGNEYGATTGRPRRVGALDLPALRYAIAKGGITGLVITKFDILDGAKTIKVCDKYESEPVCGSDFFNAKPSYTELPGWAHANNVDASVTNFVKFVEKETSVPVKYISCGTDISNIYKL